MAIRSFNPHSSRAARAHQAWHILVGMAARRETTTYLRLSEIMFEGSAPGVLDEILGSVADHCRDHGIPQLNAICVNSVTGLPGDSIPIDPSLVNSERELVYGHPWFTFYPPTVEELADAWANNHP